MLIALSCWAPGCFAAREAEDELEEAEPPPLPWRREAMPPPPEPASPTSPERVELGRLLFFDPILSRDGRTACVTCHSEQWGMSDGVPVSVGVDGVGAVGPGREGPNRTSRNAQTIWNVAYREALFWDGRAASLEEQALGPLKAEAELDLPPEEAAQALAGVPEYRALFASAFPEDPEPVSVDNLARALAAFQRTVVSTRAPYDQYVDGDPAALREEVIEGMYLFAEAGCAGCHVPPLFESPSFVRRIDGEDPGRAAVTGDPRDQGAFRIPTLRNARDTAPYFHDGSAATLQEAVEQEAARAASLGEGRPLDGGEIERVTRFIDKALTDRTRDPSRPAHVPSGLSIPEDGFRGFR